MATDMETVVSFHDLGLDPKIANAVSALGYENPTPIQARAIPVILEGQDILGQAQTGTGKTAAFALPLLSKVNVKLNQPQVLVLAPTRELAIQVAEAFQSYSNHIDNFYVLPIYGGQDYRGQLKQLKRGVHVVVGTPGRIMDHMRRGTLRLENLQSIVLDEADEMLRMGFIDDVEWILEKTPENRQTSLFSATMPPVIKRIAETHLNNPKMISIESKIATADTIKQSHWIVGEGGKLDALTRILEVQEFGAVVVFVRTKTMTQDLADKLQARGYLAAPLNGDIKQSDRERTIDKIKSGKLDILVATDVAARGLDVERVSHVVNYDIPTDAESYVHRIGRTGRAGRKGEAISFVTNREKKLLRMIERITKKKIDQMELPSTEDINQQRIMRFKRRIGAVLEDDLEPYYGILGEYADEYNVQPLKLAAALAVISQGDNPLLLKPAPEKRAQTIKSKKANSAKHKPAPDLPNGMGRFRIEMGYNHDIRPGSIVGAIVNETGLDRDFIGHISIHDDFSTIDLPKDMPKDMFMAIKNLYVGDHRLDLERIEAPKKEKRSAFKSRPEKRTKPKSKRKKPKKRAVARRTSNSQQKQDSSVN